MAALFLIFLLVASGGAAVGDDGATAALPHLQLRGTADSGREHAFDAPPQGLYLNSTHGCGRFAALVTSTTNAGEIFRWSSRVHGGLVVFCPDDGAVAAFEPSFNGLSADGQLALLRYHAVAPAWFRLSRTNGGWPVDTLASDLARGYGLTIDHRGGDKMELRTSSGGVARVTSRMVTGEEKTGVTVYLIDAVLLPRESMDEGLLQQYWSDVMNQFIVSGLILLSAVVCFVAVFFVLIYFVGLFSRRAP